MPHKVMTQHKFKVKLFGRAETQIAALKPPFDVVTVFGRKGRVPVKGTINGFPYRSSLMNMGDGHMMVVNAQVREGARCKRGDVVSVVMELDEDSRAVEVPAYLKKMIEGDRKAREFGPKYRSPTRRNMCERSRPQKDPRQRKNALQR